MRCKSRQLRARLSSFDAKIVGSYHFNNVGDMALGGAMQNLLSANQLRGELVTFNEITAGSTRLLHFAGGGANGTPNLLEKLREAQPDPALVCLLGMDFQQDLENWDARLLDWLGRCRFIGVRSLRQKDNLNSYFGKEIVFQHLDLGFFHPAVNKLNTARPSRVIPRVPGKRRLLLNLLPYFHILKSGRFIPGHFMANWYIKQDPTFASQIEKIGPAYVAYVRAAVEHFRLEGWQVEHIPFSPEDDYFAREILGRKYGVIFAKYTACPNSVIDRILGADGMIASRFHAHVFGIISGIPVYSFAYAKKCSDLWDDLELDPLATITSRDLSRPAGELVQATAGAFAAVERAPDLSGRIFASRKVIDAAIRGMLET